MKRVIPGLVTAALCLATLAAANRLQAAGDAPYDVAVIPPARVLRAVSLGHPTLAANLYWLRTVQYIGDPRGHQRGWERLYPLADLVTDLDPGHGYAYQVAGVILGTVRRISESNAILEKGVRAVPSRYTLALTRAFNAFYYQGDYAGAASFAEAAARAPGAPRHVARHVLAFSVKGNRAEAAIAFLRDMIAEASDPETRTALEGELKQALLERDALVLDAALERYRAAYHFSPITLGLLVAERLVDRIPEDPFGGTLVVGPDGRVRSTVNDFRFQRPTLEHDREPGMGQRSGRPGAPIP